MESIQLLGHLSFYSEFFLHLVRKILSFPRADSIITATEFDVTKIQMQFYYVTDNSPPYPFVLPLRFVII